MYYYTFRNVCVYFIPKAVPIHTMFSFKKKFKNSDLVFFRKNKTQIYQEKTYKLKKFLVPVEWST